MPGRRSTILYWPAASVMTDRVLSMRTSLDASTVTPGNTAPDASLTTPAMVLCARAAVGSTSNPSATKIAAAIPLLVMPLPPNGQLQGPNPYCPTRLIPTKKGDPDEERGAERRTTKMQKTSNAAGLVQSRTDLQVAEVGLPPAAYLHGQRSRRREAQRRIGDLHCAIEPACRSVSRRKGVKPLEIRRIEPDRFFEVIDRLGHTPLLENDGTEIRMRLG